jgi:hypothetical protein
MTEDKRFEIGDKLKIRVSCRLPATYHGNALVFSKSKKYKIKHISESIENIEILNIIEKLTYYYKNGIPSSCIYYTIKISNIDNRYWISSKELTLSQMDLLRIIVEE